MVIPVTIPLLNALDLIHCTDITLKKWIIERCIRNQAQVIKQMLLAAHTKMFSEFC